MVRSTLSFACPVCARSLSYHCLGHVRAKTCTATREQLEAARDAAMKSQRRAKAEREQRAQAFELALEAEMQNFGTRYPLLASVFKQLFDQWRPDQTDLDDRMREIADEAAEYHCQSNEN